MEGTAGQREAAAEELGSRNWNQIHKRSVHTLAQVWCGMGVEWLLFLLQMEKNEISYIRKEKAEKKFNSLKIKIILLP